MFRPRDFGIVLVFLTMNSTFLYLPQGDYIYEVIQRIREASAATKQQLHRLEALKPNLGPLIVGNFHNHNFCYDSIRYFNGYAGADVSPPRWPFPAARAVPPWRRRCWDHAGCGQ